MAQDEDGGDKTYEPTPQKLEDARKRGEIAKSQDVSAAAAYLGMLAAAMLAGAAGVAGFGDTMSAAFSRADTFSPRLLAAGGEGLGLGFLLDAITPLAPIFLLPFLFAFISIFAQQAFVFAPEKLVPKLSRISPLSNAKQKFGISGLVNFAKSAVKMLAISAILFFFLLGRTEELVNLARVQPHLAPGYMGSFAIGLLWRIALIAVVIAAIDWIWQRADHMRKNRMTHQEMKEEAKRMEGDPHFKAQRRRRAEEIANNRMMHDVPKADVVIVNPTHYAVALQWKRNVDAAPRVVAKGVDGVALRIRETAEAAKVPIHEDPPTARALEATVQIGEEIQPAQYQAVAAAIRFAEAMRAKARERGA